jgi:hypothetical protein
MTSLVVLALHHVKVQFCIAKRLLLSLFAEFRMQHMARKRKPTAKDGKALTDQLMGVRVGPYKIANLSDGEVYVGHENGEGGVFREVKLLPYLFEFWRKEF